MPGTQVENGELTLTTSASAAPGVYRTLPRGSETPAAPAPAEGTSAASPSAHVHSNQIATDPSCAQLDPSVDARRRFYQLRTLRREMSGRPAVAEKDPAASTSASPFNCSSSPSASVSAPVQCVSYPVPTSHGVLLDRLPANDAATRYILRTAAAEKALRHQQAENDELKRLLITQRQEAEAVRQQLERVSQALSASSDTVLRQTATMRALTSEMERRDAYHLIKDRRLSASESAGAPATAGAEAGDLEPIKATDEQQMIDALTAEVAQLKKEKTALEESQKQLQQQVEERERHQSVSTPAVEAIEREDDELTANDARILHDRSWMPHASEELQRVIEAFGRILRDVTPRSLPHHRASPALTTSFSFSSDDTVFEVTLSGLSFSSFAVSSRCKKRGHQGDKGQATSQEDQDGGVLWICGPYNRAHLLLRLDLSLARTTRELAPPPRARSLMDVEDRHARACRFYALSNTSSELFFQFYEKTEAEAAAADSTATATVLVRSLLDTAMASRLSRDWNTTVDSRCSEGISSVHTVHLHRSGEASSSGSSCGAATFTVCVSAVQPHKTIDLVSPHLVGRREHLRQLRRSEDDAVRTSLGHSPAAASGNTPAAVWTAPAAAEGGITATETALKRHLVPLMSPAREGKPQEEEEGEPHEQRQAGPVNQENKGAAETPSARRRLTSLSTQLSETTTPLHRAEPTEAAPPKAPVAPLPPLSSSTMQPAAKASSMDACTSRESVTKAEESTHVKSSEGVTERHSTEGSSAAAFVGAATAAAVAAPLQESPAPLSLFIQGVALPPLVQVPAPPPAPIPQPPPPAQPAGPPPSSLPSTTTTSISDAVGSASAALPKADARTPPTTTVFLTSVRISVKALRDFNSQSHSSNSGIDGDGAEEVEGLLEHSSVQVNVKVADKVVFSTPARRNILRAVWATEEGTCTTAMAPSQEVCFEVADASAAADPLAAVVVRASEVIEKWGERQLIVKTLGSGSACGTLVVSFAACS